MPKIEYVPNLPLLKNKEQLKIVAKANEIIREYQAQGFDLTLRQLYYQFVSRDLLANKQSEYKRLGSIIVDGRLAGLIDWDAIVDRTRNLEEESHWSDPPEIIGAVSRQFKIDKWARQYNRVEVWIEKEALAGVFDGVCKELDIPYFCCRGYTSISEMWSAGQRLYKHIENDQKPIILHFGDHDPSGMDMTRDIVDRLAMFSESRITVDRLALNMPQIDQYSPPPNPAKITDSRSGAYIQAYGDESWELDALEPRVLADLVRVAVAQFRDEDLWSEAEEEEQQGKDQLVKITKRYDDVIEWLGEDE